jgi:hypothetical protein
MPVKRNYRSLCARDALGVSTLHQINRPDSFRSWGHIAGRDETSRTAICSVQVENDNPASLVPSKKENSFRYVWGPVCCFSHYFNSKNTSLYRVIYSSFTEKLQLLLR